MAAFNNTTCVYSLQELVPMEMHESITLSASLGVPPRTFSIVQRSTACTYQWEGARPMPHSWGSQCQEGCKIAATFSIISILYVTRELTSRECPCLSYCDPERTSASSVRNTCVALSKTEMLTTDILHQRGKNRSEAGP